MFWFGLCLGLVVGAFLANDKLRSVLMGKAKFKVVPNEQRKEMIK